MTYQPMSFVCAKHQKRTIRLLNSRAFYHTPDDGKACDSESFILGYSVVSREEATELGNMSTMVRVI